MVHVQDLQHLRLQHQVTQADLEVEASEAVRPPDGTSFAETDGEAETWHLLVVAVAQLTQRAQRAHHAQQSQRRGGAAGNPGAARAARALGAAVVAVAVAVQWQLAVAAVAHSSSGSFASHGQSLRALPFRSPRSRSSSASYSARHMKAQGDKASAVNALTDPRLSLTTQGELCKGFAYGDMEVQTVRPWPSMPSTAPTFRSPSAGRALQRFRLPGHRGARRQALAVNAVKDVGLSLTTSRSSSARESGTGT